jgi:pilus assembly protein Flp/PilA
MVNKAGLVRTVTPQRPAPARGRIRPKTEKRPARSRFPGDWRDPLPAPCAEGASVKKFVLAAWKFLNDEDGATAVEYAIMLSLVILVCFAAVMTFGSTTNALFQKASSLP